MYRHRTVRKVRCLQSCRESREIICWTKS